MQTECPAPVGRDAGALRRWLEARVDEMAHGRGANPTRNAVATGWEEIDAALGGGLRPGGAHEWHAMGASSKPNHTGWTPPLTILAHLALASARDMAPGGGAPCWIAWIGRRVWPYAPALARLGGPGSLPRSLLVDADAHATRLWAIDAALRCPSLVVVADGSGFDIVATRRVQLGAESGGSLALLARPGWERAERSAALTRWEVRGAPPVGGAQRWEVILSARKGARPERTDARQWTLERSGDGAIRVVPALGVRYGETAVAS